MIIQMIIRVSNIVFLSFMLLLNKKYGVVNYEHGYRVTLGDAAVVPLEVWCVTIVHGKTMKALLLINR